MPAPSSAEVHDSSDWLPTPLSPLAPLDAALRCQVCKDFFDTPVITSCSHTFCSLCIRRCLSSEGRCPACRTNDQELKLRRNWTVDELVATFVRGRPKLLTFAQDAAKPREHNDEPPAKKRKLRRVAKSEPVEEDGIWSRRTRSQSRRSGKIANGPDEEYVVEDSEQEDEEEDGTYSENPKHAPELSDGLVSCPGCKRRMKEEDVFTHLDRCDGLGAPPLTTSAESSKTPFSLAYSIPPTSTHPTRDRLPTLNYSLLKENVLRKKMRDLGISDAGPRALVQKRHTEWLNLWNASCDSRKPKSKRELLAELDIWERTQGGKAPERFSVNRDGGQSVMSKDFDGNDWSRGHDDEFKKLIEMARRKKAAAAAAATTAVDIDNSVNSKDDETDTKNVNVNVNVNVNDAEDTDADGATPNQNQNQNPRHLSRTERTERTESIDLTGDGEESRAPARPGDEPTMTPPSPAATATAIEHSHSHSHSHSASQSQSRSLSFGTGMENVTTA